MLRVLSAKYKNKAQEICGLFRISKQSTSQDSTLNLKKLLFLLPEFVVLPGLFGFIFYF